MYLKTKKINQTERFWRYNVMALGMATILFALILVSCDVSDFGDMNENPTQSTEMDDRFILTTVQKGYAGQRGWISRANWIYASNIVQHTSMGTGSGDIYSLNRANAASMWEQQYAAGWQAVVRNVQDMIKSLEQQQEEGENVVNRMAITRILRAFVFHRLTDIYGDTPYFEAGLGFHEGIFNPRFDPQQEIYADMFKELDEAVNQFGPPQPDDYGAADLVYGGNLDQWQRFGNSLRLRLALRVIKVDPDLAREQAQAAINHPAGVMQSNDDMWVFPHEVGANIHTHTNPNAEYYLVQNNIYLSQTMVDWMLTHEDPRLRIYGAVLPDGVGGEVITDPALQLGRPNGWSDGQIENHPRYPGSVNQYTMMHPRFLDLAQPSVWFSYAEVEFMLAEADVRWGIAPLSAAEHYNRGVESAMTYLTVYSGDTDILQAEIDDYLTRNPFNSTGTTGEQLEQINTHYWAATFHNALEAWINFRRSGYPALERAPVDDPAPHPASDTGGEFPTRLTYPENEALLNQANFEAAISRQGANNLSSRVWWDVE